MLLLKYQNKLIEAGVDEAGRGALAGPVVAAAVILPNDFKNELLNDSKKLNENQRDELRIVIEKEALAYGIGMVDNKRIDEINILQATYEAMHLAIDKLEIEAQYLSIDGNRFKAYKEVPHTCIVKGDGKYLNIAAASILAKTERDRWMIAVANECSGYGWKKNKGYGTKLHVESMTRLGVSKYHRKTFHVKRQLKLEL